VSSLRHQVAGATREGEEVKIERDVACNFLQEMDVLLDKYDGMMLTATMIGLLDLVKHTLLMNSTEEIQMDDDYEEDE
jgi:hypothetical protein